VSGLFAIPVGVDFGRAFLAGLEVRHGHLSPEAFARITIFVNTRRTQRRLLALFDEGPARLLPRIKLITDLGAAPDALAVPQAVPKLRRELQLAQLIGKLIEQDPTLAPPHARFDLAESLAALMAEMQGEGVPPEVIGALDIQDEAGHWERALRFITLIQQYFDAAQPEPDAEARQRRVVEDLVSRWQEVPPPDPVIIAGSTGSRGTTALLMRCVAGLPDGAVVLPGVDGVMPTRVWDGMSAERGGEDHPQFRFKALCDALECDPSTLPPWVDQPPANPERVALVSLSLRPAPVTDDWITEGPQLPDLTKATERLTLLEAPGPRAEALAIAVRLRQAVETGTTAALITPDRILSRQVTSVLESWGIRPDDSVGMPLPLTPPGRFLRQSAALFAEPLTAEALLALLKHPLCHSGADRGPHILHLTALELRIRAKGPAFPEADALRFWAETGTDDRQGWVAWLAPFLSARDKGERPLSDWVADHLALAEGLAKGPGGQQAGTLWQKETGRKTRSLMDRLSTEADAGGTMTARDYLALIGRLFQGEEVRGDPEGVHPQVMIWGTLEARVQSADLVILGGMNEGVWPAQPDPDPWLNRRLRMQAGLLLPERRIGLSAHDYQIAMGAPEVVISRAIRTDEAETVASRWVNRLTNLLGGLEQTGGTRCLADMRARGGRLLHIAAALERPDGHDERPAPRPSPRPPAEHRPKQLSVTQIKTLIRDPYAIYARHVLGLRRLDPLVQTPDALMRGTILHDILERFMREDLDPRDPTARDRLLGIAEETLIRDCPWPATQRFWLARFNRVVDDFLIGEAERREVGQVFELESTGRAVLDRVDFTLVAKADRIDLTPAGAALIYDYKSGTLPSPKEQTHFDKQLLLEAGMVERGGFAGLGRRPVEAAAFIGVGSSYSVRAAPLNEEPVAAFWEEFEGLMEKWANPQRGYTSRRSNMSVSHGGDYDQLARYGEWDETHAPKPEDMA